MTASPISDLNPILQAAGATLTLASHGTTSTSLLLLSQDLQELSCDTGKHQLRVQNNLSVADFCLIQQCLFKKKHS